MKFEALAIVNENNKKVLKEKEEKKLVNRIKKLFKKWILREMIEMKTVTDEIIELMNDEDLLKRILNTLDKSKQHIEFYSNGYGISIVPDVNNSTLYQVAVLVGTEEEYDVCFDTPITDDVIEGLSILEAHEIAKQISELEANFSGTLS